MTPFDRYLQAAQGFLELGLPLDANDELEQIEPEMGTHSAVLAVRVGIYRVLGRWELMEIVSKQLYQAYPDDAQWPLALAYATRRAKSLQEALPILIQAAMVFPGEPTILFNLACYQAQLGYLDDARGRLREAIKLAPACRELALNDPDLEPLRFSPMPGGIA